MFRRFGFVSVMLLTLAMAVAPSEAGACAPAADGGPAASAVVQADGCGTQDCRDCGPACSQTCCHAPHVAVTGAAASPAPATLFRAPRPHEGTAASPAGVRDGPERPPRA